MMCRKLIPSKGVIAWVVMVTFIAVALL